MLVEWDSVWGLTARPEEGSMKSAQKPSLCKTEQISFAPSINWTREGDHKPAPAAIGS